MKPAAIGAALFAIVAAWDAARGSAGELSRAVVVRALAEKGFVAGGTIMMDRSYTLQSVAVTAHGSGEFTVRFRAR